MMMLPYPVSANRYWRNFRGRMTRSVEAMAYREQVQEIAAECLTECLQGCVSVRLVLHPKKPKDWDRRLKKDPRAVLTLGRMDLDNAQKVALDALQGIGFTNDRQITSLLIRLGEPVDGGGLAVRVTADEFWESPV